MYDSVTPWLKDKHMEAYLHVRIQHLLLQSPPKMVALLQYHHVLPYTRICVWRHWGGPLLAPCLLEVWPLGKTSFVPSIFPERSSPSKKRQWKLCWDERSCYCCEKPPSHVNQRPTGRMMDVCWQKWFLSGIQTPKNLGLRCSILTDWRCHYKSNCRQQKASTKMAISLPNLESAFSCAMSWLKMSDLNGTSLL